MISTPDGAALLDRNTRIIYLTFFSLVDWPALLFYQFFSPASLAPDLTVRVTALDAESQAMFGQIKNGCKSKIKDILTKV